MKHMFERIVKAAAIVSLCAFVQTAKAGPVTPANASYLTLPATEVSLTNNSTLTISASRYKIVGTGSAIPNTNTVTLTDPSDDNLFVILEIAVSGNPTNNLILIVDGGNTRLSGDWLANTNDTLTLISNDSLWIEIGQTDN